MRRNVLITLSAAVLVWGVLAIVLGSVSLKLGSGSGASGGDSPQCLLASTDRSAALGSSGVDVSPAPGTDTANPASQISFLGTAPSQLTNVSVVGSHSGRHAGEMRSYSQGDGASFTPAKPFTAGEQVTVSTTLEHQGSAEHVAFRFRVATPYDTAHVPEFPAPPAAPADAQSFYSQPGMQAPIMAVTTPDRDPAAGDVFTTNGPGPGQYGPLIYAPDGRLIWFGHLTEGRTAEDLNVQEFEGRRDLTMWKGKVLSLGFGQGEDIVMDSGYATVAKVAGGNGLKADLHEFQLAPHGIAYISAYNPIHCDLRGEKGSAQGTIVDTAIQEIDMRTGLVRWEWHSLDHIGAAESEVEVPSGVTPWDYFHLNSIDPESNGNLLISARSTWAAYQLEKGTGRVLWRLGGNRSSFKMGPGTKTAWQHDARLLGNGEVTFFDDGANPPIHKQSRALRIRIDAHSHRATLVSSLVHRSPPLLAASQGNAQNLPGGNTLVGYGGIPAISDYAEDGSLLFDAHQPFDFTFYRAFRYPWSARPATPPSILASANNTGEETIVYASWNGATGVASWRVLAGAKPTALSPQATIPDSGFESATTLPHKFSYAAVQALDTSGRTIGTSTPAKVIGYYSSLTGPGR